MGWAVFILVQGRKREKSLPKFFCSLYITKQACLPEVMLELRNYAINASSIVLEI